MFWATVTVLLITLYDDITQAISAGLWSPKRIFIEIWNWYYSLHVSLLKTEIKIYNTKLTSNWHHGAHVTSFPNEIKTNHNVHVHLPRLSNEFMMTSSIGNISSLPAFCEGNSPVNSHQYGHWRGVLMLSLIYAWTNGCVNNHDAGDLGHHRAHYDVTVMCNDYNKVIGKQHASSRAHSRLAPSQWETSLQSNAVSHWPGANLE